MDALASVWRTELAALRDVEHRHGEAAVQRLEGLQASVAQHLAHWAPRSKHRSRGC
jgi:hypothetical protein